MNDEETCLFMKVVKKLETSKNLTFIAEPKLDGIGLNLSMRRHFSTWIN